MANLILMRHAKSDWTTDAPTDFERPLNGRGRRNAATMARWVAAELPHPNLIVSSPSERTRQTVFPVCESLAYPPDDIRWEGSIYEGAPGSLLEALRAVPDDLETVMLVGHNPGMEVLTTHLCAAEIPTRAGEKAFPTAAVAYLHTDVGWRELDRGRATLIKLVRPRDLANP